MPPSTPSSGPSGGPAPAHGSGDLPGHGPVGADLILIAYDGSENARRAVRYAGRFLAADKAVLVTVWEPMVRQTARMSGLSGMMQPDWLPDDDTDDVAHTEARQVAEEGLQLAAHAGLDAEARCIESGTAVWTTIIEIADELDADVIVAGTRGSTGLRSLIHSSTAQHVLHHSHRPVMIVPPGLDEPPEDPSAESAEQAGHAEREGAAPGAG